MYLNCCILNLGKFLLDYNIEGDIENTTLNNILDEIK